jgi:phosphonate transport system substrate-binding protein
MKNSALRTLKSFLTASFAASLMFAAAPSQAQSSAGVLRVSAIPDEAPT